MMGTVMYPQMVIVPPIGGYLIYKGTEYEPATWQRYAVPPHTGKNDIEERMEKGSGRRRVRRRRRS